MNGVRSNCGPSAGQPDLAYVPTAEGCQYPVLILDLFSRKLVGWAMSDSMAEDLTLEAPRM